MAALSDAQLKQIADRIFVMRDRGTTRLPKPTPTGAGGFKSALDPLATQADFKDAGIGILDFTVDPKNPNVWLHNENTAFRIGSASKIAMMLAAVHLRLDVRRILALNIISTPAEFEDLYTSVPPTYSYLAMTPVPRFWHPYVVEEVSGKRRFVQGRAADLSGPTAKLMPAPISDLLADPKAPAGGPVHQLEPAAIPPEGLRIQRRAMLARATTGEPVLWTQRRRDLLLAPPTFALRFDVLREDAPAPSPAPVS